MALVMTKSMKYRHLSNFKEINQLVIQGEAIFFHTKTEISLSNSSLVVTLSGIDDIVVINNPATILDPIILFV